MSVHAKGNAFLHRGGTKYMDQEDAPKNPCAICGFAARNKRHLAKGRADCHAFMDESQLDAVEVPS